MFGLMERNGAMRLTSEKADMESRQGEAARWGRKSGCRGEERLMKVWEIMESIQSGGQCAKGNVKREETLTSRVMEVKRRRKKKWKTRKDDSADGSGTWM